MHHTGSGICHKTVSTYRELSQTLLKVKEKTILDWLVDDINPVIDEFIVISNHRFAHFFEEWAEQKEMKITVVDDGTSINETRLGAVKDIQFAIDTMNINDDCVVMAGDNVLDFSLQNFVKYAVEKKTSCVMCHEEHRLAALQKTAVITMNKDGLIDSYEEKPKEPKGTHAVPPFYYYRKEDIRRIPEALDAGCGYDAPGSFAAWLSSKTPMHAYVMPGKRYDIGDMKSYTLVQEVYQGINK